MNDKEFERTKKQIKTLFDKWSDRLWLSHWEINYHYLREGIKDQQPSDPTHFDIAMTTSTNWPYLIANIEINCPVIWRMLENDKEGVESTVVHELCHVLVAELEPQDVNREERVVSMLQRIMESLTK